MKRLASLKQHHPSRQKSTDLNLLQADHEYLLDDKELLNKLRYSATVADLCSQELNNNNVIDQTHTTNSIHKVEDGGKYGEDLDDGAMGSNVSRFSDKGLSGRRTQSSGECHI